MKIYVIERDNNSYRPEPEIYVNYDQAINTVKREFDQIRAMMTNPETEYDISENYTWGGSCAVSDPDVDNSYCFWRVTAHELDVEMVIDGKFSLTCDGLVNSINKEIVLEL